MKLPECVTRIGMSWFSQTRARSLCKSSRQPARSSRIPVSIRLLLICSQFDIGLIAEQSLTARRIIRYCFQLLHLLCLVYLRALLSVSLFILGTARRLADIFRVWANVPIVSFSRPASLSMEELLGRWSKGVRHIYWHAWRSKWFNDFGPWPSIIELSIGMFPWTNSLTCIHQSQPYITSSHYKLRSSHSTRYYKSDPH